MIIRTVEDFCRVVAPRLRGVPLFKQHAYMEPDVLAFDGAYPDTIWCGPGIYARLKAWQERQSMLNTEKPEDLEQRADELEKEAAELDAQPARGRPKGDGTTTGDEMRKAAVSLRARATALRSRRTDGIRFG